MTILTWGGLSGVHCSFSGTFTNAIALKCPSLIIQTCIRQCHSQIQQNVSRLYVSLPSKNQMTEQSYPDFCILEEARSNFILGWWFASFWFSTTSFRAQLCIVFKYSENKLYLVRALGSNPKIFTFWSLCNVRNMNFCLTFSILGEFCELWSELRTQISLLNISKLDNQWNTALCSTILVLYNTLYTWEVPVELCITALVCCLQNFCCCIAEQRYCFHQVFGCGIQVGRRHTTLLPICTVHNAYCTQCKMQTEWCHVDQAQTVCWFTYNSYNSRPHLYATLNQLEECPSTSTQLWNPGLTPNSVDIFHCCFGKHPFLEQYWLADRTSTNDKSC